MMNEVSVENWDGNGARAVAAATWRLAERLLGQIPDSITRPEIGAGPSGEIILYWWGPPTISASIELWPDGRLVYAGLFGRSRVAHGSEEIADELPPTIELALRRVTADGSVGER
jgi:hypothetical protein